MMRPKIRLWLQFLLHNEIVPNRGGHSLCTINPASVYAGRYKQEADTALLLIRYGRVAENTAVSGQPWIAIRRELDCLPAAPLPTSCNLEEDPKIYACCIVGRTLQPMQKGALLWMYNADNKEKKVQVVHPTGAGNTLIIMTMTLFLCGVHLVVHPLLILIMDQVVRFSCCSDEHGTVVAINLDDQIAYSALFLGQVPYLVLGLSADTNTTVFLFGSP